MAKRGPDIRILAALLLVILALLPGTDAHSGVERLMRIAENGTMIGPEGFPRGFTPRSTPTYNDFDNYYLVPPNGREKVILPDDKLIHPCQRSFNYTDKYPPLKAAPGDLIALQYQENGHTTLPDNQKNKTKNRGTVFIYGTSELNPDYNLLDVHYKWNEQGTGGDGKGKLIATRNYDDGRCHENNAHELATFRKSKYQKPAEDPMGENLWCQNDVALPADIPVGKPYTLVWVWDWPTMWEPGVAVPPSSAPGAPPSAEGIKVQIPELYVTTMDINIVDPCAEVLGQVKGPTCSSSKGGKGAKSKYFVDEGDYNKAAIQEQLDNMFLVDVTALIENGNGNANNPAAPAPSSDASAPSGTASSSSICTKSGNPKVTTTTITPGGSASAPGNKEPAPAGTTTTLVETMTATTVTVTVVPETTQGPVVVTETVTTYDTTVTVTVPPSSSSVVTSSSTTSSVVASGRPTVTSFLKDTKPTTTANNKNRRAIGQWGFGARGGGGGGQLGA